MSIIKQLLRLKQQGKGKATIARILGMSRNTVKEYLRKLYLLDRPLQELLDLEDMELEKEFHAGSPAYKQNARYDVLRTKLDHYVGELRKVGVTKHLLWQEYIGEHPDGYGFTQFCHHLSRHMKVLSPSMVLSHEPGEELFVDFAGKKLSYVEPRTGEIVQCPVFVACLPFSDLGFAMAVRTQGLDDFLHALACCLKFLGGVPKVLVPDNLKAAIIKASPYEPDVNAALADFAEHYGMTVVPTRPRKPKDKALVENHVKLVYTRVFAKIRDQRFFDMGSLNEAISVKMREHLQTRMQHKDRCREEIFRAEERPLLSPLPEKDFELKYHRWLKVAKNNHVFLSPDKRHYSVPYHYIGQKAKVIFTASLVRIYVGGEQVAVHPRVSGVGYSTQKEHLCSQHQHYLDRSPEYYLDKAKRSSRKLHELVGLIFQQDSYPEQLYKTCDGLLRLQRNHEREAFEKACQMAIDHETFSYRFISNVLANKMTEQQEDNDPQRKLPEHANIRGSAYYQQLKFKL